MDGDAALSSAISTPTTSADKRPLTVKDGKANQPIPLRGVKGQVGPFEVEGPPLEEKVSTFLGAELVEEFRSDGQFYGLYPTEF
ncbi:uncharacterized protein LOC105698534 isoform X2 [Orussus abietinus]|uniref:uncharacterized protein LOC105698534 isoform X2 n=1 Tax=Orussus abietinus TaxID=222816 RepID=UPI000625B49D|nr:uncharacterized protein LOC105698534 isoform X2 [Orussus abietinus]